MAEAFLNYTYSNSYDAYSAGTEPTQLNPIVIQVMAELEIDISEKKTKSIDEFKDIEFDIAVTVCDNASKNCPFFPALKHIHQGFPDPSALTGTNEEIYSETKRIRDQIRDWIEKTF